MQNVIDLKEEHKMRHQPQQKEKQIQISAEQLFQTYFQKHPLYQHILEVFNRMHPNQQQVHLNTLQLGIQKVNDNQQQQQTNQIIEQLLQQAHLLNQSLQQQGYHLNNQPNSQNLTFQKHQTPIQNDEFEEYNTAQIDAQMAPQHIDEDEFETFNTAQVANTQSQTPTNPQVEEEFDHYETGIVNKQGVDKYKYFDEFESIEEPKLQTPELKLQSIVTINEPLTPNDETNKHSNQFESLKVNVLSFDSQNFQQNLTKLNGILLVDMSGGGFDFTNMNENQNGNNQQVLEQQECQNKEVEEGFEEFTNSEVVQVVVNEPISRNKLIMDMFAEVDMASYKQTDLSNTNGQIITQSQDEQQESEASFEVKQIKIIEEENEDDFIEFQKKNVDTIKENKDSVLTNNVYDSIPIVRIENQELFNHFSNEINLDQIEQNEQKIDIDEEDFIEYPVPVQDSLQGKIIEDAPSDNQQNIDNDQLNGNDSNGTAEIHNNVEIKVEQSRKQVLFDAFADLQIILPEGELPNDLMERKEIIGSNILLENQTDWTNEQPSNNTEKFFDNFNTTFDQFNSIECQPQPDLPEQKPQENIIQIVDTRSLLDLTIPVAGQEVQMEQKNDKIVVQEEEGEEFDDFEDAVSANTLGQSPQTQQTTSDNSAVPQQQEIPHSTLNIQVKQLIEPIGTWRMEILQDNNIQLENISFNQMNEELSQYELTLYEGIIDQYQRTRTDLYNAYKQKQDALMQEKYELLVTIRDSIKLLEEQEKQIRLRVIDIVGIINGFKGERLSEVIKNYLKGKTTLKNIQSGISYQLFQEVVLQQESTPSLYTSIQRKLESEIKGILKVFDELESKYQTQTFINDKRFQNFLKGVVAISNISKLFKVEMSSLVQHLSNFNTNPNVQEKQIEESQKIIEKILLPYSKNEQINLKRCVLSGTLILDDPIEYQHQFYNLQALNFYLEKINQ